MKKLNLLLLIPLFYMTTAFAYDCNSVGPEDVVVSLPFKNQSVSIGKYQDGVCFPYKLNQGSTKKVICEFSQFKAGWLVYFDNGLLRTSDDMLQQDFKGSSTVILTSKGETKNISKNTFQIHVDDNEAVAIHHDMSHSKDSTIQPQASCRYEDDN